MFTLFININVVFCPCRQQSGIQGMPAPYRDHRSSGRGSPSQRHSSGTTGSGSRRYRPY